MERQWLAAFELWPSKIDRNNVSEMNNLQVENLTGILKRKYKNLFSDSPGPYNKSKSKIYLKENARPVALKCRNVAHMP